VIVKKRPTLADVAERAGLSKTAVSLVLNGRTGTRLSPDAVERARRAAADLNYRPNPAARSLRMGKLRTVGFISDDVAVTRYASAMIRGLLDVADHEDHTVLIAESGGQLDRAAKALEAMLDRQADGIIFGSMAARQVEVPEVDADIGVVLINMLDTADHPSVLPDEHAAGRVMANELIEAGHRRIGMLGWYPDAVIDPTISVTIGHRFAGIQARFDEAGIRIDARYVARRWDPPVGYAGAHELLEQNPNLTALLCLNDNLAFGAYQAAHERRLRIPEDLSIVSFDDDELAGYLRPQLTTAQIPYEQMGRTAMHMLLSGEALPPRTLVPMPLRRRNSVHQRPPRPAAPAPTMKP
jgi:LacI family transcriptional regulator